MADVDLRRTLAQVESLEREIERVKRDLLRHLSEEHAGTELPSLYGTVAGGDIPDELIHEAQRSLFQGGDTGS